MGRITLREILYLSASIAAIVPAARAATPYYVPLNTISQLSSTTGSYYQFPSLSPHVRVKNVGQYSWQATCNGTLGQIAASTGCYEFEGDILTNATGLPISTGVSGLGAGVAAGLAQPWSAGGNAVTPQAYGAICDGTYHAINDTALQAMIDAAIGPSGSRNGTNTQLNLPIHIIGKCVTHVTLNIDNSMGLYIVGDGKMSSGIINNAGTNVLYTNKMSYSYIGHLLLQQTTATGIVLSLDNTNNTGLTDQQNTIEDASILGGQDGVVLGASLGCSGGCQIDTNTFINVFAGGSARYCMATYGYNTVDNNIFGGDIQGCGTYGIYMYSGTFNIYGTGFQNQMAGNTDIYHYQGANDAIEISGARTESANFLVLGASVKAHVSGVTQLSSTAGVLVYSSRSAAGGSQFKVDASYSLNGQIIATGNTVGEVDCATSFGRTDWLGQDGSNPPQTVSRCGTTQVQMGAGSTNWVAVGPSQSVYVAIPAGSASVTVAVPANAYVRDVRLVISTSGTGTINVGDSGNATLYFSAHTMTASVSTGAINYGTYYASGTTITATTTSSSGVVGYVRVDYQIKQSN